MKCSVTSVRGQPTSSPLTMAFLTPFMPSIDTSKDLNWSHVAGTVKPLSSKKDFLYQKPGLIFPVYVPP